MNCSEEKYTIVLKRLVAARKGAGLSQSQVAKLMGLDSPSTISHYESDARGLHVRDLLCMCELYGVSVAWVMTGANPNFDQVKRQEVVDAVTRNGKIAMDDLQRLLDDLEMLDG